MKRHEVTARLPQIMGMNEIEAAAFVGVSTFTFRQLVADGRMPRPRIVNSRRIWDSEELRAAFKALPIEGEAAEPLGGDL